MKTYTQEEVDEMLDRQASITTDQVLKNQSALQEENKKLKEGIEYAIAYLQKGGFGRVDCLNKLLSTLNEEKK